MNPQQTKDREISLVLQTLESFCENMLSRVLTQVCRDSGNPAYGCFDRNWWHYKMRDFPSIILQQGGYALLMASHLERWKTFAPSLRHLAQASCRFWAFRAVRRGAFEEYYPFEQGYPPLAFSTLAVMKMVHYMPEIQPELFDAACIAARQLEERFEMQAANQQMAGLAAYAWLGKNYPQIFHTEAFENLKTRTLALQHEEGWFEEYGGPDLGYLSVTLDCLWDLFDATDDTDFIDSASKALQYMTPYVAALNGSIGMHNSRNTDYLVPYGIARFLERKQERPQAEFLLNTLFASTIRTDHFLQAVDDRYLIHYIGHSLVRACLVLQTFKKRHDDEMSRNSELDTKTLVFHPGCGHYLSPQRKNMAYACLISLRKGGIITALSTAGRISDFGWIVEKGRQQFVTHWWGKHWTFHIKEVDNAIILEVDGTLIQHKEILSNPWKHLLLRLISFIFGPRIIRQLKNRMIFKTPKGQYTFHRKICLFSDRIVVEDQLFNVSEHATVQRAPRFSKRHVASADSFHPEDFQCDDASCSIEDSSQRDGSTFNVITTYRF